MRKFPRRRGVVLGVGLIAVLIGGGVVVAVAVGGDRGNGGVSTVSSASPIATGVIRHVVASLNDGRGEASGERPAIVSARIGTPPDWWARSAGSRKVAVPAVYVRVRYPRGGGARGPWVKPLWETDLLVGAVAELAGKSQQQDHNIGYIRVSARLPDGTVARDLAGGIGPLARRQQFRGSKDSDATIRHSVERVASAFGLAVDTVTVFRAVGAAPAVVLTAPHPAAVAAQFHRLEDALFGSPRRYEGYYLEIRRENGKAYIWRSFSSLTGTGRLWLDPSLGVPQPF